MSRKRFARKLATADKGNDEGRKQTAALLATFQTPEAKRELKLDRQLIAIPKALNKKQPPATKIAVKLVRFGHANRRTKVGRRAEHIGKITSLAAKKKP